MTTVVWDGKAMHADMQTSYHRGKVSKLYRDKRTGNIYGFSGNLQDCIDEIQAIVQGTIARRQTDGRDVRILRACHDGTAWMKEGSGETWVRVHEPFVAIGSGSDYAMGAMEMMRRRGLPIDGAEALNIAHAFDDGTGPEIQIMQPEKLAEEAP